MGDSLYLANTIEQRALRADAAKKLLLGQARSEERDGCLNDLRKQGRPERPNFRHDQGMARSEQFPRSSVAVQAQRTGCKRGLSERDRS